MMKVARKMRDGTWCEDVVGKENRGMSKVVSKVIPL